MSDYSKEEVLNTIIELQNDRVTIRNKIRDEMNDLFIKVLGPSNIVTYIVGLNGKGLNFVKDNMFIKILFIITLMTLLTYIILHVVSNLIDYYNHEKHIAKLDKLKNKIGVLNENQLTEPVIEILNRKIDKSLQKGNLSIKIEKVQQGAILINIVVLALLIIHLANNLV